MADKIDVHRPYPATRSVPSTNVRDRRKKPEDQPRQNKNPRGKRPEKRQDEGPNIDEYV